MLLAAILLLAPPSTEPDLHVYFSKDRGAITLIEHKEGRYSIEFSRRGGMGGVGRKVDGKILISAVGSDKSLQLIIFDPATEEASIFNGDEVTTERWELLKTVKPGKGV